MKYNAAIAHVVQYVLNVCSYCISVTSHQRHGLPIHRQLNVLFNLTKGH